MRRPLVSRLYHLGLMAAVTWCMFLVMRLADFWWNRPDFSEYTGKAIRHALLLGLRFDASALAYLMALPTLLIILPLPGILARRRWHLAAIILFVTTAPLFAMGWVDIELVRFVKARMTASTLFLFREGSFTFSDLMKGYAVLIIGTLFFLCLWAYCLRKIAKRATTRENEGLPLRFSLYWILALLLIIALLVVGIRGGIKNSKPLRVVDTYPDLKLGNWALNTPFTFITELRAKPLREKSWFNNPQKLIPWLNGSSGGQSLMEGRRPDKPQNVVIFMMESLAQDQMGRINGQKGFTPFIDELSEKSLFFHEAYANATRSIEGVPAVLGGIPAWGTDPFLVSPYANAEFEGLGTLLSKQGYATAFFHGGKKGTMFLDKFATRAGFEKHYSREDYPNPADIDTSWGVFDEPWFQYVAGKLDEMHGQGKPFAVGVFSLTAHFPFNIPEKYKSVFPEGPIRVLRSQAYADMALRRFFETARTKPWYKDTLFIVTADHGTQVHLESYRKDPLGEWRIPVIFFHPSVQWPVVDTGQPVEQIDILPSVADFLGVTSDKLSPLGRSLFKPGPRVVVVRTNAGIYNMEDDAVAFEPKNGGKPVGMKRKTADRLPEAPQDALTRGRASTEFYYNGLMQRRLYLPGDKKQ
ncbi:MAG: LTA synthase family protein [Burkholderiaceae bacterium]|jgi:phosphoglycerol transferase MdoB-like AlkP superfamily enzyme|nr:LTA synthase family protein [Burkholderiaceae bacterium]